jgi:type I restriction enzyme S subunit
MVPWRKCKLGEVLTLKRGYDLPRSRRVPGPYPVVSSSGIIDHHFEAKTKGSGVVTGRYGTLGEVFYISEAFWPLNTSLYVVDFKGNLPSFIAYLLRTLSLESRSAAGAVPGVNRNHLHAIPVRFPPPPIQRRIAGILSAYDDLIENNLRRIRILEEMARAIYREWFVYFRFPGHESVRLVDSSLGPIPQGSEVRTVQEMVKRLSVGKKYDQKTVNASGAVPVLDQGKSGIIGYHDDAPGVGASEFAPIIVFANHTCYQSANHTCYQRLVHFPFSAIQNVLPFVPSPLVPRNVYWLHWATKGLVVFNDYKGHWPEFAAKSLVVPPTELCQRFGDFVSPTSRRLLKLERVVENLRRTRDLLLPRLLSGTIDISDSGVTSSPNGALGTLDELAAEAENRSDGITVTTKDSPLSEAARTTAAFGTSSDRQAQEHPKDQLELGRDLPLPIDQTDRSDVLAVIRQLFSDDQSRTRENAIRDVARALGYGRVGHRIRDVLHTDLLTASRRGVLENVGGELRLPAHSIAEYHRDFLKQQFLSSIGRSWIERENAIREFCKWMGFSRTGPIIEETARSLISGLLRESRLEADGPSLIRRRA